ncbi:SpoIVB peptidase S55 domain-containing protein [Enhygromyxa salina]|uniref:SpoIVB peptidase S55 n=1 Tax=Enhygromyxa salina TaxID=215803 RepID=A0A2S9XPV3_9BACT|nr:SpoIVB peptidase S55 domain-containing protein [Enhygromyxa salina]PRP94892.1 SpoIVB peptidase S55 [Enhygromyxa salina]
MATSPDRTSNLRRLLRPVLAPVAALATLYGGFWLAGDAIAGDGSGTESARPGKRSKDANIIPIDDIKPGMKGYALTVFEGEVPDKFEIEVVDVVRDYVTGQDAVLFRSPDPRLVHTGIVGGMSGSPIYIQDKLAGALAYGYRFGKDPLGGMTPIENMLEVADLPYRPEVFPKTARASGRTGTAAWADQMLALGTDQLPARQVPEQIPGPNGMPSGGLAPIGAPMSVAGLSPHAAQFLADATGLVPVLGGGSMRSAPSSGQEASAGTRHKWTPGDSVSVVLIAGDNGAAPNGTVTWVGGAQQEKLLAFGHPMYGEGPSKYPIANGHVHTILASVERSVKLSSPRDIQGTMIQDRQPAISLRTDIHTPMIPVTTSVTGPDPEFKTRSYHSAVADSEVLTPPLVTTLMLDAIEEAGSDAVEVVLETRHEILLETSQGPRTLVLDEETYYPRGIVRGLAARSRALLIMMAALDNPFELASIKSVKQSAVVHYGAEVETIDRIRITNEVVRAGDLLEILVDLKPPRGPTRTQTVSVRIPADAGGERVVLELGGGEWITPYAPLPGNLDDLLDNLAASYPARSIIGTIYRPGEGLATEHGLVQELPESVLQTLSPGGSNRKAVHFKQAARRVIRTNSIIRGEASLEIDVRPAKAID